jgi:hypothetical protein
MLKCQLKRVLINLVRRRRCGLGLGRNPHLPHNHYENSFCYPGTHDNETSQGWYESQDTDTKLRLSAYAGITENEVGCCRLSR